MIVDGHMGNYKLPRRPVGLQEKFGFGTLLAFFTTKVIRGGPRILLHPRILGYLAACFVLLLLVLKVLPQGYMGYDVWSWQKTKSSSNLRPDVASDGSVSGGLRVVVFGGRDVATAGRMPGGDYARMDKRSWTELLCEELDCSSYLVFEPDSAFSHSMTSTKLYAESLDQVANKTGRKDGPGWDYSFLPKTYPVTWNIPDLEEQISSFLALQKPQNTPAETLWVFSFGMWDIWSLASEPLSVSKPMVDDILIHLFTQVERVYHSTMDESSIAWSAPLPTPEAAANTTSAKPQQLDFDPEEHDEATEAEEDEPPPKQFKVLIPKLFDPSMTPGWRTHRPDQPAVHSKAEQMRNAAMLTEYWNSVLKRYLFSWARTGQANSKTAQKHTITFASGSKETPTAKEAMANFKASLETEKTSGGKVSSKPVRPRGDLGVAPRSAPEPAGITTSDKAKKQEANQEEDFTPTVERDAILFGMDDYLLDLMVDREMRNAGIQDSKGAGTKPTEEGFLEVRKACTQALEKTQDEVKSGQKKDAKAAESSQPAVRGRGPTPATSPSEVRSDVTQQRICEAPHEHLFLTPFTVSPRAVAAVAKLAADMVRQNQTVRASWTNIPKKLPVKVIPPASRRPHGGGTPAK